MKYSYYAIGILFFFSFQLFSFQYGSGTESDPYQLWNLSDLQEMSDSVNNGNIFYNEYFILMNDIDTLKTPINYYDTT
jgi:hypothetical protein